MPKEKFKQYIDNFIKDFSKKYNIRPEYAGGCLCEEKEIMLNHPEIALVHPHDSSYCHEIIKYIIADNPGTDFYLFAIGGGGDKKIQGIGDFSNLTPIRGEGDLERLSHKIHLIVS